MADFILHRKISADTYPFPKGAFKIYGDGKFYNGFSIGDATKLTVVNKDGVLKFSREATVSWTDTPSVILGTIPPNNKVSIYIDVASPLPDQSVSASFQVGRGGLVSNKPWITAGIYYTDGTSSTQNLQAGGVVILKFLSSTGLEAIPNLCSIRALWAL